MTAIFGELAVIAEPLSEEDKVVHLLASLPPSYDVLVTAFESGSENVPALEIVTERLLREEENIKGKESSVGEPKELVTGSNSGSILKTGKKIFTCHYCGKAGHYKRHCRKWVRHQAKTGEVKHSSGQPPSNMVQARMLCLLGKC